MWLDGNTPCYLQSQVVSECLNFRPIAPILFSGETTSFLVQKGVWPYRYADDIPLVTLILNVYVLVGLIQLYTDRQIICT